MPEVPHPCKHHRKPRIIRRVNHVLIADGPAGLDNGGRAGFGGGEHLAWQAAHNPAAGLIGAEPFVNGVGKLLVQIDEQKLKNVRVHFGDARPLMEALPDGSLSRLFAPLRHNAKAKRAGGEQCDRRRDRHGAGRRDAVRDRRDDARRRLQA